MQSVLICAIIPVVLHILPIPKGERNMKKISAFFLALCLCFGFAACRAEQKEMKTDIVGEWIAVSVNANAVFYEDGTGEIQYNGKQSVTWMYDPDTEKYVVTADQAYDAFVGKEYDMPYMSIMGIDFYRMDDYDKAYTLMLSKRLEDIMSLTVGMSQIKIDTVYDLANAVTIKFTKISVTENEETDGLVIEYMISNNRTEAVTENLSVTFNGKFYLANRNDAMTMAEQVVLTSAIEQGEIVADAQTISLGVQTQPTIDNHGMFMGVLCFEMYEQNYYIDLGNYFTEE